MSDDQALPRNPLISAATRSGQSRAVMEITRFEASTRALRGCGCPADTASTSSPPPLAQLLPREPGDGHTAQPGGCTHLRGAPLPQFRGMREAWQPRCSSIPPVPKLHQFAAQILKRL